MLGKAPENSNPNPTTTVASDTKTNDDFSGPDETDDLPLTLCLTKSTELDPSQSSYLISNILQIFQPIDFNMSLSFLAVVLLVVLSALLSGSEVAMFSINTEQRKT